ncbi:MAG: transcriptional regulator [Eubacterium sp.]|jgi:AcrR family transcriptional regulator|nr:transcriptional regulator [Eubacterium sp.]
MEKKPGRPRSEETKKAILSASYGLLLEIGFKAITVEGIAERAGVSKATIYKWWPGKAAVVLDGFFAATEEQLQIPDTGSAREDLFIQTNTLAAFLTSEKGRVITELIAEGQSNQNIADEYRSRYFKPRRQIAREILQRGVQRGEIRKNIDIELTIDLIFAPIFYRLLAAGGTLDAAYLKDIIYLAFEGINFQGIK